MNSKLCSWEHCTNPRAYFWQVESQFLCHSWLSKFHSYCQNFVQLIDIDLVGDDIADLESWMRDVQRYITAFNLERNFNGIEDEARTISLEIQLLKDKYEQVLEHDDYTQFKKIHEKMFDLRNRFLRSSLLNNQLIHEKIRMRNRPIRTYWDGSTWSYKEDLDREFEEELIKVRQSIKDNYKNDVIQKMNEQKRQIEQEFEEIYKKKIEDKNESIEKLKEQLK